MSIQAAPRVRTVRRINRADSRVREDDTGVKAKPDNEGEEREDNDQRGQNRLRGEVENENNNKTAR